MKVLLIDDDKQYRTWFAQNFSKDLEVESLNTIDADEIGSLLISKDINAIIIDLHMPQVDGISLWRNLQKKFNSKTPGYILSESFDAKYRELALSCGLIDYLHKEMSQKEILLRLKNGARHQTLGVAIEIQGLKLNEDHFSARFQNNEVTLTKTEFQILKHLSRSKVYKLPRNEIMSLVWPDKIVVKQTLNTHLFNLNDKLNFWPWTLNIKDDSICLVSA